MSRIPPKFVPATDRASLYTEITDKIIAELEAGLFRGCSRGDGGDQGAARDARNASTQRGYSGINY